MKTDPMTKIALRFIELLKEDPVLRTAFVELVTSAADAQTALAEHRRALAKRVTLSTE